jgi:hypothetical protein
MIYHIIQELIPPWEFIDECGVKCYVLTYGEIFVNEKVFYILRREKYEFWYRKDMPRNIVVRFKDLYPEWHI